jgi:hypothetical protein
MSGFIKEEERLKKNADASWKQHDVIQNDDEDDDQNSVYSSEYSRSQEADNAELDHDDPERTAGAAHTAATETHITTDLTAADLEIYQRLNQEYDAALEERDVAFTARYQSVRQSACFAVTFMLLFMTGSVLFFLDQAEGSWDLADALLFSVYSITTVGYGHLHNPRTDSFQIYTIFFILMGIATLTIMVAQVYQCLALEASRAAAASAADATNGGSRTAPSYAPHHPFFLAQLNHNTHWVAQHHWVTMGAAATASAGGGEGRRNSMGRIHGNRAVVLHIGTDVLHVPIGWMERLFLTVDQIQAFLKENEIGRGISVLLPFLGLILIGAAVIGPLEGWTVVEAVYFSVVSLTTVGFGDYYPRRMASIWFSVIWLPCSIGFMSLYLTNVAAFYIRLSDRNIARIEKQLQRRLRTAKRTLEQERDAARRRALRGQESQLASDDGSDDYNGHTHDASLSEEIREAMMKDSGGPAARRDIKRQGFDTLPMTDDSSSSAKHSARKLFGTRGCADNRRERILKESQMGDDSARNTNGSDDDDGRQTSNTATAKRKATTNTMTTMRDVLRTVRFNLEANAARSYRETLRGGGALTNGLHASELFSIQYSETVQSSLRHDQGRVRKPSFALRVLVQERVAEIIATDVAGYQDSIEIEQHTISVSISSLKQTADRWMIPRRARKAFRAVAFEVLFFVGEYGLVARGAEALYDLSPLVFHGLFAPVLAALGDAELMEAWLTQTQVLAEVDLRKTSITRRVAMPGSNERENGSPTLSPSDSDRSLPTIA